MAEGGKWVVEWEGGDKEDTEKDPRHLKIKSESLKVHKLMSTNKTCNGKESERMVACQLTSFLVSVAKMHRQCTLFFGRSPCHSSE